MFLCLIACHGVEPLAHLSLKGIEPLPSSLRYPTYEAARTMTWWQGVATLDLLGPYPQTIKQKNTSWRAVIEDPLAIHLSDCARQFSNPYC